jgi:Pectinacetylesterase
VRTGRLPAVALLLAAGLVACTDDAGPDADADGTVAGDSTTASGAAPAMTGAPAVTIEGTVIGAAFEFARCMRANGIPAFADPTIRADGDFSLTPPAGVGDEELRVAEEVCEHVLPWRGSDPSTVPNIDQVAARWERIVPGGDCECSDGSEFSFWVREANPDKVLVYLQEGGACFSVETCASGSDLYNTTVGEGPTGEGGIFDLANARNPFADYSVVYVPYCTGDVHLGNTTTEYAPGLIVHHDGYVNGSAALDHVAATAPGATDVVVVGESAGAIAAPLYAGLVSDRLPGARIRVLADGSGSYPDVPRANEILAAWGFGSTIPAWPENAGPATEQWSFPGLFIQSGRHDPDIVFARHDYASDEQQQRMSAIAGIPTTDLLSRIDANETEIEAAGVNLLSYVAPGGEHTALTDGTFYTEEVDGQPLVEWVARLIEGEPVEDVHCMDCTAG